MNATIRCKKCGTPCIVDRTRRASLCHACIGSNVPHVAAPAVSVISSSLLEDEYGYGWEEDSYEMMLDSNVRDWKSFAADGWYADDIIELYEAGLTAEEASAWKGNDGYEVSSHIDDIGLEAHRERFALTSMTPMEAPVPEKYRVTTGYDGDFRSLVSWGGADDKKMAEVYAYDRERNLGVIELHGTGAKIGFRLGDGERNRNGRKERVVKLFSLDTVADPFGVFWAVEGEPWGDGSQPTVAVGNIR